MLRCQLDRFVTILCSSKVVQWCCEFSRVQDVVAVEIDKSEKRLHLTNLLRSRPVSEYAEFRENEDTPAAEITCPRYSTLSADSEQFDGFSFRLARQILLNTGRRLSACSERFFERLSRRQDTRDRCDRSVSAVLHPSIAGKSTVHCRVRKASFASRRNRRHDKSCSLDVRRLHGNLIIRHREIEAAEDCGASERVESFIEAWQRKTVKFRREIQTSMIYAHLPAAVLLSNHHDWIYPRRSRRARDVSKHEPIDFELDSGAHFPVRQAADRLTEGTHIAGIYLV